MQSQNNSTPLYIPVHTVTEQLNTVVYTNVYRHRITQHRCIYQCIQTQNNSTSLYIPMHTDTEQLNTVVYTSAYRHRITQHRCIYQCIQMQKIQHCCIYQCIQTQNNLTPLYIPMYTDTE